MLRREFIQSSFAAVSAAAASLAANEPELKFGHRQANMVDQPGPSVFDLAKRIQGLSGVELQVYYKGTTLCDPSTLSPYKKASQRTGLPVPSIAGIWPPGEGLLKPSAEEHLRNSIVVAHKLDARTILAATFEQNCPNMNDERSYGPVVTLLQKVSAAAKDAGVVIGMETSNSPADDRKLIDLVDRPSIKVYYDLFNVEHYEHKNEAVPGIRILTDRIRQVHLKNEDRLLEEQGPVDWAAAVEMLAAIHYRGWFMFETSHHGPDQCIAATRNNIAFVRRNFNF